MSTTSTPDPRRQRSRFSWKLAVIVASAAVASGALTFIALQNVAQVEPREVAIPDASPAPSPTPTVGSTLLVSSDPSETIIAVDLPHYWVVSDEDQPYAAGQPNWEYVWQEGDPRSINTPNIVLYTGTDETIGEDHGSTVIDGTPEEMVHGFLDQEWGFFPLAYDGPHAFTTPDGGVGAYLVMTDESANDHVTVMIATRWEGVWTLAFLDLFGMSDLLLDPTIDGFVQATLPDSSRERVETDGWGR